MRTSKWLVTVGLVASIAGAGLVHASPPRFERQTPLAYVGGLGTLGIQYDGTGKTPIVFVAEVDNPLATTIRGAQLNFTWQPQPTSQGVSAKPAWMTWTTQKTIDLNPGPNNVALVPGGAIPVCGTAPITLQFTAAPNLDPSVRFSQLRTSNCSYTATLNNPWNQMEPDRVVAAKVGVVWVNNATMTVAPDCNGSQWANVRFDLVNASGKAGKVEIDLTDPLGNSLAQQIFTLGVGQGLGAQVALARPAVTGPIAVKFYGSNSNGGFPLPTVNPGLSLDFEGTCTVSVDPVHGNP